MGREGEGRCWEGEEGGGCEGREGMWGGRRDVRKEGKMCVFVSTTLRHKGGSGVVFA